MDQNIPNPSAVIATEGAPAAPTMSTAPDAPWTKDPAEHEAVLEMQATMRELAAYLRTVDEARYADPSGGYVPGA